MKNEGLIMKEEKRTIKERIFGILKKTGQKISNIDYKTVACYLWLVIKAIAKVFAAAYLLIWTGELAPYMREMVPSLFWVAEMLLDILETIVRLDLEILNKLANFWIH